MKERVSIIGYGRFGRLWASILENDFDVVVSDLNPQARRLAREAGANWQEEEVALASETIFYCVPISAFEDIVRSHLPRFKGKKTLIDTLSVKVHPRDVFERVAASLPPGSETVLTHPMFGPDSFASNKPTQQKIVIDAQDKGAAYRKWVDYLRSRNFMVMPMDAEDHDRIAAESQGVTHFVGRILAEFRLAPTDIDTAGAIKLQEIKQQIGQDTWQLFEDLQSFNPYTRAMRVRLAAAQSKVFDRLLPNRINKDRLVVGIQGGRGSFNEQAARYYLGRTPELDFELVYLHTTEKVLEALHRGDIDRGQFAMHNSLGGIVTESVEAMARYNFHIVEEFAIKISHALMMARGADFTRIDTIMTHPQVLRQCRTNLQNKYSKLKLISGSGDLVDHARVAELMGRGELAATVATMGSRLLAELNDLEVIEDNLQDLDDNYTSFLWVERPEPG